MRNAITIDLEDYYQVTAFSAQFSVEEWEKHPSRIEHNTARLLAIFDEAKARATFFALGWIGKKYPRLLREIAEAGHEIACHSNAHRSVYEMEADDFRADTLEAKKTLEDTTGRQVYGYRAPSFSVKSNSLWAYEILAELGFLYDSSIFPIRHLTYGWPQGPRSPFVIRTAKGPIIEFPMPTLELWGVRAPIGGGAYFRLLPYWYTRWGLRYINQTEKLAVCFYLHPWELDSEQPRMRVGLSARLRHYFGLRGTDKKFRRLLNDFAMQPLSSLLEQGPESPSAASLSRTIPQVDIADLLDYLNGKSTAVLIDGSR